MFELEDGRLDDEYKTFLKIKKLHPNMEHPKEKQHNPLLQKAKDDFGKILTMLGHNYCEAPNDELTVSDITRHLCSPTHSGPVCMPAESADSKTEQVVLLQPLFHDINCPKCRQTLSLPGRSLTKRTLMLDTVNILINIEQEYLEQLYWNTVGVAEGEDPINVFDGAPKWEKLADWLISVIERSRSFILQVREFPKEKTNKEYADKTN